MGFFLRSAVVAWAMGPLPAAAATHYVPSAQHPTLASAVSAAVDGDLIEVDAIWTPSEPAVAVDVGVTIRGASGVASLPALVVDGGAGVTLEDVSLVGGGLVADTLPVACAVGGAPPVLCVQSAMVSGRGVVLAAADRSGVAVVGGTLELAQLDAVGLAAGPAVVAGAGAVVTLVDASFIGNPLGAVIVEGGTATVEGCTFRDNGDPVHWGLGVDLWVSDGAVTVSDSVFSSDAVAGEVLGAVYLEGATASFTGSEFDGYRADRGAVWHALSGEGSASLVLDQVTVVGAHAGVEGGAAWLDQVETTIVGSVFTGLSTDGDGAGFFVRGGSIDLLGVRASDLRASGDGGFVRATDGAQVQVHDAGFAGTSNWVAAGSGGAFSLEDSSLEWATGWARNLWVTDDGAVVAGVASTVHLEQVSLENGLAGGDGGAVAITKGSVALDEVAATGNIALRGGALWADGTSSVEVQGSWFQGNVGLLDAGAVGMHEAGGGQVVGNRFCANDSGLGGAAVSVIDFSSGALEVHNNVFQDNLAGAGGTLFVIGSDAPSDPSLSVVNNTFVGNYATAGAVAVADTLLVLRNNILMGSTVGLVGAGVPAVEGGYNLWYGNDLDAVGALFPGTGAVRAHPAFHDYTSGDCDAVLWLAEGSPARDAGDPLLTDPDGSRSDIGAYGGPGSALPDADADGRYADLDCADDSADVHPGATEVPYDGIDQDCDGADLCDVDADGFDAWDCGGPDCDDQADGVNPDATEVWYDGVDQDCDGNDDDQDGDGFASDQAGGSDCDDGDASTHPGAEEQYDDHVDQDCDGSAPRAFFRGSGGCGCAFDGAWGGGSGPALGALAVILLAFRRRRPLIRTPCRSRLAKRSG
jgi:MYXO-CTERM domain-containing protein